MTSGRTIVAYGRYHTTSYMLIHVLARLLARPEAADVSVEVVLDDRRDLELARGTLPPGRASVRVLYMDIDPFSPSRSWADETVQAWERAYGDPHLRRYIGSDRVLEGRPEAVKWGYLLSHIDYFERLVARTKPAALVCGPADGLAAWVALNVFRANGVRCISLSPSRFGVRTFVLDGPYEVLGVRARYRALLDGGLDAATDAIVRRLHNEYRADRVKPVEHVGVRARRRRPFPNPLTAFRLARETLGTDARNFDQPLRQTLLRAARGRRTWLYRQVLRRRALRRPVDAERYFFFPLQLEPEATLITQGRGWTDQLALAELLAHSLPIDRWLYVKEHPTMLCGVRGLTFYRRLLELPRIRLVDQDVTSRELIARAEGVVTVGGTAGWEALMAGKPVVLFGHAFYEEFTDGVSLVDDPDALPGLLRSLRHRTISEPALHAFLAAVIEAAPAGLLTEPRILPTLAPVVMADENLERLVGIIASRLEPRKA